MHNPHAAQAETREPGQLEADAIWEKGWLDSQTPSGGVLDVMLRLILLGDSIRHGDMCIFFYVASALLIKYLEL